LVPFDSLSSCFWFRLIHFCLLFGSVRFKSILFFFRFVCLFSNLSFSLPLLPLRSKTTRLEGDPKG
jgi:hypothetical protein